MRLSRSDEVWELRTNAPISEGRSRTTNHRHFEDGVSRFESPRSELLALGRVHNRCKFAQGLLGTLQAGNAVTAAVWIIAGKFL